MAELCFLCTTINVGLCRWCESWAEIRKRSSGPRLQIAMWPWLVLTWVPDYPSVQGVNASVPSGSIPPMTARCFWRCSEFPNFDDFDEFTLDDLRSCMWFRNDTVADRRKAQRNWQTRLSWRKQPQVLKRSKFTKNKHKYKRSETEDCGKNYNNTCWET